MKHTMWLLGWSLVLSGAATQSTAVIALDDSPAVAAVVMAVAEVREAAGEAPASQSDLSAALTGSPTPRAVDEGALRRMITDAREYEGRFETRKANELRRQVLRAFESVIRPSQTVRLLAGEAGLDLAAGLLSDGDRTGAERAAREALRHFPMSVDTTYRSPTTVDFLEEQQRVVAAGGRTRVTILSDRAGRVFSDGILLGETDGELETALWPGRYRLWLEWTGGASLPRVVNVEVAPLQVQIDTELDGRLRLEPVVRLQCDEDCTRLVAALGARFGTRHVVGVRPAGTSAASNNRPAFRVIDFDTETGETRESLVGADGTAITSAQRRASFHPLYLLPFGGGQFAQDRPVFGAAYATAEAGLLAWFVVSWRRHADATADFDVKRAGRLEGQRNLAATILLSSLAVTVAECLVVGWLTGG